MRGMYSGLSKMSGMTEAEIKQQMELRPELIRNLNGNRAERNCGSETEIFKIKINLLRLLILSNNILIKFIMSEAKMIFTILS